ncbi:MAG TPA: anti-sigma factor [Solirubrobacteraceae bacterium]|nr:anti-sigma factor [Solirubrobacteraceae bacterium]
MSDRDRTADRRECGGDVAAYALGALDAAEAEAFRRHLDTCSVCQEELTAFAQVVNELPLATAPHTAPTSIRRKVMREVRADARARAAGGSARRAVRSGWGISRPALALGATLLVAVVVAVAVLTGSSSSSTHVYTGQVVGTGSAQLRVGSGRASLVVHHFAQPPAGKIYEMWLVHGSKPPSPTTQLFSPTSAGNAVVEVPGGTKGVSAVLVTPEPMGGSPHPTHTPVINVTLS